VDALGNLIADVLEHPGVEAALAHAVAIGTNESITLWNSRIWESDWKLYSQAFETTI
jgi:hypothetical protein